MQFPLKSWSEITTSPKQKKIELKNLTFIEYQLRYPLKCPAVMSNFALENKNVFLRANSFKLCVRLSQQKNLFQGVLQALS